MQTSSHIFFPAKILLFGEYVIIHGGKGLAIPYPKYGGSLGMALPAEDTQTATSQTTIAQLCRYLQQITPHEWDFEAWLLDVQQGLYFGSNVPQGFGLGSSGALVAALYARYYLQKTTNIDQLKQILAQVESYFHGKSSGLDPLVSYLQCPVLITQNDTHSLATTAVSLHNEHYRWLLWDSGISRQTAPLVAIFQQQMTDPTFAERYHNELVPHNEACIAALLAQDSAALLQHVKVLSQFQLAHFAAMIPAHLQSLWQKGIADDTYYFKLCGAGGGGFFLALQPASMQPFLGFERL
jgi:mevalonate kinase